MGEESKVPLLKSELAPHNPDQGPALRVGVIGTGNYALALTKRLTAMAGCDVIIGSRKPELRRASLSGSGACRCGVVLTTVRECVRSSDLVIVAIHREYFSETLSEIAHLAAGKVVIDVSNRETRAVGQSNAEYLESILPEAAVVKAFNSVSAFAMEDLGDSGNSRNVYVAGNDPEARNRVIALAQAMGFRAVNLGHLQSARWMENELLSVFALWKIPIALALAIYLLCWLFVIYIYWIDRPTPRYSWEQIFIKVNNKPVCMTAITLMALTYLPGHLASILQVYYGTKHRRFPQFLDTWLKSRKQLGLVSFILVALHAVMSVLIMSSAYFGGWFHKRTLTLPANLTLESRVTLGLSQEVMTWRGEVILMLGILGLLLMTLVAVTSIRSVGDSLNWGEWRAVQSRLGHVVLVVSVAHVTVKGAEYWWRLGFPKVFRSAAFMSVLIPYLVLALKLAFSLPPLAGYLRNIRRGWERPGARYGPDNTERHTGNDGPFMGTGVLVSAVDGPPIKLSGSNSGSVTALQMEIREDDTVQYPDSKAFSSL
ncbi:hypothetical protein EGW08_017992 [Elysia chlorotica]|uniref:Pyrroline-5-carboxylate reductase catalytic N-terminal domain-containing protein n=1 Tax=Elysia chlorotica TaxID=188477 RepID=A0A433SY69_ELYCH|nr:hypothetical protein EGW08_017992 [Elysia chlorotica]